MNRLGSQPMSMQQFLLLLHSVPKIGDKTLSHLLRKMAQSRMAPIDCLALSQEEWRKRLHLLPEAATFLFQNYDRLLAKSAEDERALKRHHVHLFYLTSAAYPPQMEERDPLPPPLLYAKGNLSLLESRLGFTFCVMISNHATEAMLQRQKEIVARFSEAGGVLVTGHDRQPYKRAALTAQSQARPILYGFDQGLRRALGDAFDRVPFREARIEETFFNDDVDLAISPFPLNAPPMTFNLKLRDRLVLNMADVILVLDARQGGVMQAEALRALENGRTVYVAEGGREGGKALLEKGATAMPATKDWVPKPLAQVSDPPL